MAPLARPIRVLKFGGAALADAARIRHVAEIVRSSEPTVRPVIVVSALYEVTDQLEAAIRRSARRDEQWREALSQMRQRHLALLVELASSGELDSLTADTEALFSDLEDLLQGTHLLRECSPRSRDAVLSFGERCSAPIVAAAFRRLGLDARSVDARRLITTDNTFGRAEVDTDRSFAALRQELQSCLPIPVVTGFVGATQRGETTTLGRGGSDYTAALLAAALGAAALELWKDVDGVLSADPRVVPEATALERVSYSELMELSHFGAKVIYPPSVHPTRRYGIPLHIRNFNHPDRPGTTVTSVAGSNEHLVRGISSIPKVALLRLEGDGMVGVPGIAMRLFGALARRSINIILISQGSSEHSICFAVAPEDVDQTQAAVSEEFALERRVGLVDQLIVDGDCSILALVGEGMREHPGIAGRLFSELGSIGVSVRALAQGSSELNLSLVIRHADHIRALQAAHTAFFAPAPSSTAVAVLGQGNVGGALLDQIFARDPALRPRLRLVALANRKRIERNVDGIDLAGWRTRVETGEEARLESLLEWLHTRVSGPRVVVDCTSSADTAALYPSLLRAGIGVVAANKQAFAATSDSWRELQKAAGVGAAPLRFETTVGAGLPVLSTLSSLLRVGDRVTRIEGVLSGTLNFLSEQLAAGCAFSAAVRAAHDNGFTEPHPWDDLSGEDVRRKLCILARLSGIELEPEQISVQSPLPGNGWGELSLERFWKRLPEADEALEQQRREAESAGSRLRFLGRLVPGESITAGLVAVPAGHPCFDLSGTDNLIAFSTESYRDSPLVVRGPGAGPEPTAAGVLADLLAAADELDSPTDRRGQGDPRT